MANFATPVNPAFPDVYVIEASDPVQGGGENTVSNRQARQLVERTQHLKNRQDDQRNRGFGSDDAPVQDPNLATAPGLFTAAAATPNHPRAGTEAGMYIHMREASTTNAVQVIIYRNSTGVFTRRNTGGTWQAWVRMLDASSIVQAAGSGTDVVMSQNAVGAAIAAAISGLVNGAGAALDTLNELAAALGNDPNFATTIAGQLTTLTNQVAAIKQGYIGQISIYEGPLNVFDATGLGITPGAMAGWAICNGNNGTRDYRDRMPLGAGSIVADGGIGGSQTHTLAAGNIPQVSGTANNSVAGVQGSPGGNGGNMQAGSSASIANVNGTVTVGNSSPTPVNHMPPYIGVVWVKRIA